MVDSNGVSQQAAAPVLEVSEESPGALQPNKVVTFMAKREAPSVFYFDISESSKITVEVWDHVDPEDDSHIDMRMIANDDQNDL